jgi:hypothetical protein
MNRLARRWCCARRGPNQAGGWKRHSRLFKRRQGKQELPPGQARGHAFCDQKKQKKLYEFLSRAFAAPREAEQKSFLVLFFKKELLDFIEFSNSQWRAEPLRVVVDSVPNTSLLFCQH